MVPDESTARAALERILASECFSNAQRHKDFLRYIVEEAIAGRGDRIKGYSIAVEVLERPEDFDAQNDPYVRVEAGRLRKRLAEYYLTEGTDDPVRIAIKKGSYEPEFSAHAEPSEDEADGSEGEAAGWPVAPSLHWGMLAAVVIPVVAILAAFYAGPWRPDTGAQAPSRYAISVVVQPFENIGNDDFDFFAMGLTEEVLVLLSQYEPMWGAIDAFAAEDFAQAGSNVAGDFSLTGTVVAMNGTLRVTSRIVDLESGQQVWTSSIDERYEGTGIFDIQDRIAANIVNIVREPNGPIAEEQALRIISTPIEQLGRVDCQLLFQVALHTLSNAGQDRAKQCMLQFVDDDGMDAAAWSIMALIYYWDYENGSDLRDGMPATIGDSYAAVQRALDLDGTSLMPHVSMAFVNIGRGQTARAIESTERALGLNPPPSIIANLEALRLRLDSPPASVASFDDCVAQLYRQTPYMFVGPTFHFIRLGEYGRAMRYAERIDAPDSTMAQVFWAALSALTDQPERARRHVQNILDLHPRFREYGAELIGRWTREQAIVDTLIEGLSLAGLDVS